MNNITSPNSIHPCTSCQLCAAVCPKGAITIRTNEEGFYRPVLDESLCIDCGLCTKVCYKYKPITPTPPSDYPNIEVWAAACKDEQVLKETTSGGVADVFARELIKQGYYCCGVTYDSDANRAVNQIAVNEAETLAFRGSKYIQSYTFPAFKKLISEYAGKKIAVFGTPCHIFAIDQYLKFRKKREQAILIDFYCHGCPSLNLWKKYVKENLPDNGTLSNVRFRSKHRGWGQFCIEAQTSKGKYVSPTVNDSFYTLFFSDHVLNESCHTCELRSTLQYTDIRIGDFWGKIYDLNKKGVSIVTPVTEVGKSLFKDVKDRLITNRHRQTDVIPYQSWGKTYTPNAPLRKRLLTELADENIPLKNTIKHYRESLTGKQRLKLGIKNIILRLPSPIISLIKKIYH